MNATERTRPKTLEEALRALDEAEAKLRTHQTEDTGIRRLKESVKRSEERFRMLAEGVPNHLLFLDRDLRIEFANDVFLEAAGWTAEKAMGLHISEIMGPERYLQRQPFYERALAGLSDLLLAVREATEACCPGAFDHLMTDFPAPGCSPDATGGGSNDCGCD